MNFLATGLARLEAVILRTCAGNGQDGTGLSAETPEAPSFGAITSYNLVAHNYPQPPLKYLTTLRDICLDIVLCSNYAYQLLRLRYSNEEVILLLA
jgi:hypothetical protein